jgi:prepilin signal peptidase PulO-like enzyme (type II secretory pathway)
MDGKVIGTENSVLFDALKANDVEVLDAAKLQAKIGATSPWTGKAWLLVQAEVEPASFKVQGLLRTPANILVNLSTDALN